MIITICVLLGIAVAVAILMSDDMGLGFAAFLVVMLAGMGGMVGVLIALLVWPRTELGTWHSPIASLRTNHAIEGSFVLGTGHVRDRESYLFFYDLGDGRYQRGSAETGDTMLVEKANVSPRMEWELSTIRSWWVGPVDIGTERRNVRLVVPPGTIVRRFEAW